MGNVIIGIVPEPHDKIPIPRMSDIVCDDCDESIPEGEAYYEIDGLYFCRFCMEQHRKMA